MDRNELSARVTTDEDYIRCPKFGNSLSRFINKNPDGIENDAIARLLLTTEEEVNRLYEEAVALLREEMLD